MARGVTAFRLTPGTQHRLYHPCSVPSLPTDVSLINYARPCRPQRYRCGSTNNIHVSMFEPVMLC